MMQEYAEEDGFFFEEDKMALLDTKEPKNNEFSSKLFDGSRASSNMNEKKDSESAFPTNNQLPEAQLYDGICGEIAHEAINVASTWGSDSQTQYFTYEARNIRDYERLERDRLGMTVSTGMVKIEKDPSNMIGISIGGGAPYCPCLYIVQIFDGTPAAKEGTLQSGDELLAINGTSVKGKTKVEVAKMIQGAEQIVKIHYNKLHADPEQGETLDIVLKKMKHRLVENISASMADNLGLSRAILCNDSLVKRLKDLQTTENVYKGLVDHAKRMLKSYFDFLLVFKKFGDQFVEMSVREPSSSASEAFRLFGEFHRGLEKEGISMIKSLKPVIADFGTYLHKAIPDTKLTVNKYLDAKFAYLSYCLKVKEMDDEEHQFAALQEPLYRVETGNYEYRLILRCRSDARAKFSKLRTDVLEKIELLEGKHERDLKGQLERFITGLHNFHKESVEKFKPISNLFPIEIDLKPDAFQYNNRPVFTADGVIVSAVRVSHAEEATETTVNHQKNDTKYEDNPSSSNNETSLLQDVASSLIPELDQITVSNQNNGTDSTTDLLLELGLADVDLTVPQTNNIQNVVTQNSDFTDFFDFTSFESKASMTNQQAIAANQNQVKLVQDLMSELNF
uniref:PRKCA-binding protein n=1 Tax=Culicoides sonorensis TaxID=179676 RepID=A0A336KGB0_CULSO